MAEMLRQIVRDSRAGRPVAIPSVCSAHPEVIAAALGRAATLDRPIVIEATSNQVNQDGGYTGQRPGDFIAMVQAMAAEIGLDPAQLAFGGDHLGPQAWRGLDADAAMARADRLVRDYVGAGFLNIHLDCSQGCKGEDPVQGDAVTAARTALLARACVEAADGRDDLMFVIGTEVPPPGGARVDEADDIAATDPARARATLDAHRTAFAAQSVDFDTVTGLVLQPGVEFSPMRVHHFPPDRALPYRALLADWPGIVLEAHSTDYQRPQVFRTLAAQGFAFQKVGPALTFAWRQAAYGLDLIRGLLGGQDRGLMRAIERLMTAAPQHWNGHYRGDAAGLLTARHFGLADRIRYYWPLPKAQAALAELRDWADGTTLPDPLLLQVFPQSLLDRAEGLAGALPDRLLQASVHTALDPYFTPERAQQAAAT